MLNATIKLSRRQLYDEIWQMSLAGVARKYNLNYAKLISKCKESNIPFPSSGDWTRKNMGKDVSSDVVELPDSDILEVELILKGAVTPIKNEAPPKAALSAEEEKTSEGQKAGHEADLATGSEADQAERHEENQAAGKEVEQKGAQAAKQESVQGAGQVADQAAGQEADQVAVQEPDQEDEQTILADSDAYRNVLQFMAEQERIRVSEAANNLEVNYKKRLHPQLVKYKNAAAEWKRKVKESQGQRGYYSKYALPKEPDFFNEIASESQPRVIQILNAIFHAVEALGGQIRDDLSMKVKADVVQIRVAEGQDKIKHELTKQEARALVEYNDKIRNHQWASKPQIRKYDHVFNGKLRIIFADGNYIRDNASERLEDRLGDILFRIYEKSEALRIEREKREEEERKRQEALRRQEEARKRKNDEIERTKQLLNQAEDYRIACEIRAYISAIAQKKNMDAEMAEWIEWAKKKADWYDPIVSAEDEYLGKRDHWKSKEEKDLDRMKDHRFGGYRY